MTGCIDTSSVNAAHCPRTKGVVLIHGFNAADFEGAAKRVVTYPKWEGKIMLGEDYFLQHAMPNFYFHITHSYAILRHNGVDLGKKDYVGQLSLRAP
jgi:hypothetical protein